MDGSHFDAIVQLFVGSRRSVLWALLSTGTGGLLLLSDSEAKRQRDKQRNARLVGAARKRKKRKKKKNSSHDPCAPRCQDGCCESAFGACIPPRDQGGSRCGTAGELCKPCEPLHECAPDCGDGCCSSAFGECLGASAQSEAQCGSNGELCQECFPGQYCVDQRCCSDMQGPCDTSLDCCDLSLETTCESNVCCRATGAPCQGFLDCCGASVCELGTCCHPARTSCEESDQCCHDLPCTLGQCCRLPSLAAEEFCLSDDYCCPPYVCGLNRVGLHSNCCHEDSSSFQCLFDAECCSLTCYNGACCTDGADPCDTTSDCCGSMICGGYLEYDVCCYPHGASCNEGMPTGGACCDALDQCLPTPSPSGPRTCRRPD